MLFLVATGCARADDIPVQTVPQGGKAVLLAAPCIVAPAARTDIAILPGKNEFLAVYSAPPAPYGVVEITLEAGKTVADGLGNCAGSDKKTFRISDSLVPAPSPDVVRRAFTILMTALVLALLLEQAFALLFNWRLFVELVVGKAWRTPIMFAAAYALSRQMDIDLVRDLTNAYGAVQTHRGDTLSHGLTAAILAGGSVGINHLLISLGFRSQLRPDVALKPLDATQAWLAIRIDGAAAGVKICIDDTAPSTDQLPALAGTVATVSSGPRLRHLFFPDHARFPRSGGYLVSTAKAYRISVLTAEGKFIDMDGNPVACADAVPACRFASRAVVDLQIRVVG
jgi:hypothetical protein